MQVITEPEPSRDLRRVINAVHDLSELEAQIALCKTIDEVEEIRLRSQAIQSYARQRDDLGPALVTWAKRCAVLCQLRITELQEIAKRKRNGEVTNVSDFAPATRSERSRVSERRAILAMPKEELEKQLAAGNTEPQKLAHIARKMRKKPAAPKSTPAQLEAARTRYNRAKAKKRGTLVGIQPPPPKLSPSHKFERYWTQEKKLLQQFFGAADLPVIKDYWLREFQSYCMEVEDGERERNQALAKLKTTTTQEKELSVSEAN